MEKVENSLTTETRDSETRDSETRDSETRDSETRGTETRGTEIHSKGNNVKIFVLGQFKLVNSQSCEIKISSKKVKLLLAILVYNKGKKFPRNQIAELLWSRHAEENALTSLRQALSRLKSLVGEDFESIVISERRTLALNPQVASDLDSLTSTYILADFNQKQLFNLWQGRAFEELDIREKKIEEWISDTRQQIAEKIIAKLDNKIASISSDTPSECHSRQIREYTEQREFILKLYTNPLGSTALDREEREKIESLPDTETVKDPDNEVFHQKNVPQINGRPQGETKIKPKKISSTDYTLWLKPPTFKHIYKTGIAALMLFIGVMCAIRPFITDDQFPAPGKSAEPTKVAILPLHTEAGITVVGVQDWSRRGAIAYINQSLKDTPEIEVLPLTTVSDYLKSKNYPASFARIDNTTFESVCKDLGCSHLINISHVRQNQMETAMTVQLVANKIDFQSGPLGASDNLSTAHRIQEYLSDYLLLGKQSASFTPVKYSSIHEANQSYAMGLYEQGIANNAMAIKYYRCAIEKDPVFIEAHSKLLQNLSYTLESDEAHRVYQNALALNLSPIDQLMLDAEYANHLTSIGEHQRSLALTRQTLAKAKELDLPALRAKLKLNLAKLISFSEPDQALALLNEANAEFDNENNNAGKAAALLQSSIIQFNRSNFDQAIDTARSAEALFKQEGDHFQVRQSNLHIGQVLLSQGHAEKVKTILHSYEDLLTRSKNPNLKLSILTLWRAYSEEVQDRHSLDQIDDKIRNLLEDYPILKTARYASPNEALYAWRVNGQ